jgi:hypothetical protein
MMPLTLTVYACDAAPELKLMEHTELMRKEGDAREFAMREFRCAEDAVKEARMRHMFIKDVEDTMLKQAHVLGLGSRSEGRGTTMEMDVEIDDGDESDLVVLSGTAGVIHPTLSGVEGTPSEKSWVSGIDLVLYHLTGWEPKSTKRS